MERTKDPVRRIYQDEKLLRLMEAGEIARNTEYVDIDSLSRKMLRDILHFVAHLNLRRRVG